MPELFVITGPNGAGKSSHAKSLLPKSSELSVFDGDKLFYQLLDKHYKTLKVNKYAREKAGEELDMIFNQQVENAINFGLDYAYEGHFTNEPSWNVLRTFKSNNYKINLIFVALESVELSMQRVALRVASRGHHVPPAVIYDNFYGNVKMLDAHLELIDCLKIFDNSDFAPSRILMLNDSNIECFTQKPMPDWLTSHMPNLRKLLGI